MQEAPYQMAIDQPVVALIFGITGEIYDQVWTWQTAQNYANQGYRVVAIADDGYMTAEEAQELYDWERDCFQDCFGRDTPFEVE